MEEIVGDEVARVFGELILRQERDATENERGAYGSERHTTYDLQRRVQALERNTDAKRDLSDILPLPHKTETLHARGSILGTSWPAADRREGFRVSMTGTRFRSIKLSFRQLIVRRHPVESPILHRSAGSEDRGWSQPQLPPNNVPNGGQHRPNASMTLGAGDHGTGSCAPNRYQAVPSQRAIGMGNLSG